MNVSITQVADEVTHDALSASVPTVLLVDDHPVNLDLLTQVLEPQGYRILVSQSGEEAVELAGRARPDLILLDVMLPGADGFETCRQLKSDPRTASVPILFISARTDSSSIVEGFAAGGVDYLAKPFQADEVLSRVGAHLQLSRLNRELAAKNTDLQRQTAQLSAANARLREEIDRRARAEDALEVAGEQLSAISQRESDRWGIEGFIGRSPTIAKILKDVRRVQNFQTVNVLITGESGTGKELVARAIHTGSPRASGPFVPVNCVAVPDELAESIFFGHLRGAFTGATMDRKGCFEMADRGTLFLDEIGDMSPLIQAKLLRALEDGLITPLGGNREKKVSVRVVAATNADLEARIAAGQFRQDLYFRLAQFTVHLPPLRTRRDDIPILASHFLGLFATEMGMRPPAMSKAALESLVEYSFPGNVRELKNIIERSLIESGGEPIGPEHLKLSAPVHAAGSHAPRLPLMRSIELQPSSTSTALPAGAPANEADTLPLKLDEAEGLLIQRALAETNGNVAEAARRLGINRTRIYRRLAGRE